MVNKTSITFHAINLLSKKEYSRNQLFYRLKEISNDEIEINDVLNQLEKKNFLSTNRFVDSIVERKKSKYGYTKIIRELIKNGTNEEKIEEIRNNLKLTEYERALNVLRKRFIESPKNNIEYAKQIRFLSSRGFSKEVIFKIIKIGKNQ